jgi:hypothetical protein
VADRSEPTDGGAAILRIQYAKANVYYEDSNKRPTPEHVEDTLLRMERCLNRTWAGKSPEQVNHEEYEASTLEDDG